MTDRFPATVDNVVLKIKDNIDATSLAGDVAAKKKE
jgi:hypothetical protein